MRRAWLLQLSCDGVRRLQTNYDHWEQPPSSDDRRTPGDAHMVALGQRGVGVAGLLGVLTTW